MFCLATYNIWNTSRGMPIRERYILNELKEIGADILCLQEVHDECMAERIARELKMKCHFSNYSGEQEGICVLYKGKSVEFQSWMEEANAIYQSIEYMGKSIGIVNLHLPWDSPRQREKCIERIFQKITHIEVDQQFIMGDFNCSIFSDIHRMMLGDTTINGVEANPNYYDLAFSYAQLAGREVRDTLDFKNNPRFRNNTIEVNQRFDRIMMRNTYPEELPILLESNIFGTKIYEDIGLAASDHYGVFAKLRMECEH